IVVDESRAIFEKDAAQQVAMGKLTMQSPRNAGVVAGVVDENFSRGGNVQVGPIASYFAQIAPRAAADIILRGATENLRGAILAVVARLDRGGDSLACFRLALNRVGELAEHHRVVPQHRTFENAFHVTPNVRLSERNRSENAPYRL